MKTLQYKVTSQGEMAVLITLLELAEWKRTSTNHYNTEQLIANGYLRYPWLSIRSGKVYAASGSEDEEDEIVSYHRFIAAVVCPLPEILVPISDDYTAIITPDGITVGCQYITWEVFDKVVAAATSLRKVVPVQI